MREYLSQHIICSRNEQFSVSFDEQMISKDNFPNSLYNWENYFIVIGWEEAHLSLTFNLHCSDFSGHI